MKKFHVTCTNLEGEALVYNFLDQKSPVKARRWAYWLAAQGWASNVIIWDGVVGGIRLETVGGAA